jgi:hypothetical protein
MTYCIIINHCNIIYVNSSYGSFSFGRVTIAAIKRGNSNRFLLRRIRKCALPVVLEFIRIGDGSWGVIVLRILKFNKELNGRQDVTQDGLSFELEVWHDYK